MVLCRESGWHEGSKTMVLVLLEKVGGSGQDVAADYMATHSKLGYLQLGMVENAKPRNRCRNTKIRDE